MNIEYVTRADYKEIVEVWEDSVRSTHNFLREKDIAIFKPLILEKFLDLVDLRCVKDSENRISGFLGVAEGNIEMLFLRPCWIGQGVGKFLVNYGVNEMGACRVDVNEQNSDAVGFYRKMGFEVTSRSELDGMGKPYPILHMKLKK